MRPIARIMIIAQGKSPAMTVYVKRAAIRAKPNNIAMRRMIHAELAPAMVNVTTDCFVLVLRRGMRVQSAPLRGTLVPGRIFHIAMNIQTAVMRA